MISGEAGYGDICDQIEGKENGAYVLMSKFEDDVVFEYHITIMEDEFNLGILEISCLRLLSTSGFSVPSLKSYVGRKPFQLIVSDFLLSASINAALSQKPISGLGFCLISS